MHGADLGQTKLVSRLPSAAMQTPAVAKSQANYRRNAAWAGSSGSNRLIGSGSNPVPPSPPRTYRINARRKHDRH